MAGVSILSPRDVCIDLSVLKTGKPFDLLRIKICIIVSLTKFRFVSLEEETISSSFDANMSQRSLTLKIRMEEKKMFSKEKISSFQANHKFFDVLAVDKGAFV